MSSDLMTSTMKSEPSGARRLARVSFGVPVSAAIGLAVGGSADGTRARRGARRRGRIRGLRRHRARSAGDGHSGQELAAIDFGPESFVPNLACHDALPANELLCGDSSVAAG